MLTFDAMLERIEQLAHPRAPAVKSGEARTIGSFPNMVTKLCLFAISVTVPERREVLALVDSEVVRNIASYTFSVSRNLEPSKRHEIMEQFNGLVKRYVVILRRLSTSYTGSTILPRVLAEFTAWHRSWNAVLRRDVPAEEAAKQLCRDAGTLIHISRLRMR